MSGTVDVRDLRIGMYIHLDLGWMSHPFPVSSFRIANAQQLDKIGALGLKQLRWSAEKSDPADEPPMATPPPAVPAAEPIAVEAAETPQRALLKAQHEAAALCQAQFDEASAAWRAAHAIVPTQPERARTQTEQLTRALLDKMLVDADLCIRLLTCNAGDGAGRHEMNVAVVSMLLGRTFGLDEQDMLDLGVGALMHDVGKLDLSARQRHVDERCSAADVAAYREHVAPGVAQGRRMGLSAGALLVLAQHHEHADGTGFPLRLQLERMSVAARIVSMVNRYDNLCNPALLAHSLTPHEALSQLFAQARSKFDSSMLNAFIRMMGVYPAGSVVQLTDERFGLVISVNSTRPLKPNVLVHDPRVPRDEALHLNLMSCADLGIRRSLKQAQLPGDALEYLAPRPRTAYFFEAVSRPVMQDEKALA
jgi:HD-GYP domain-containing protein (c-di-GMP phosphodiesterase class II)